MHTLTHTIWCGVCTLQASACTDAITVFAHNVASPLYMSRMHLRATDCHRRHKIWRVSSSRSTTTCTGISADCITPTTFTPTHRMTMERILFCTFSPYPTLMDRASRVLSLLLCRLNPFFGQDVTNCVRNHGGVCEGGCEIIGKREGRRLR